MRIGIMLRALDEKGGVGVYTRYVTEELLALDRRNQYVLFYRNASHIGRFSQYSNASERVLPASNKVWWDQVSIPYACWKEKLDVLFHPKFTVPLAAPCKTVMVLHGAGWFMPDGRKFWNQWDLRYVRRMMPIYCRKAAAVISVSQLTTDIFNQLFHLPAGKIRTVYFGPGKQFRPVKDASILKRIKERYNLSDQFILTLARYGDGGRKNTGTIFEAYSKIHGKVPHTLVVGGKNCHLLKKDYNLPDEGYGKDIVFVDWIEQEDLPAFYSLADLFLYPSNVEAFPIPITEAMACGRPIITSNANGLKEIAGDAAVLVNPHSPDQIAEAVYQVLSDPSRQRTLSLKSLERARAFSWQTCAKQTLAILQSVAAKDPTRTIASHEHVF